MFTLLKRLRSIFGGKTIRGEELKSDIFVKEVASPPPIKQPPAASPIKAIKVPVQSPALPAAWPRSLKPGRNIPVFAEEGSLAKDQPEKEPCLPHSMASIASKMAGLQYYIFPLGWSEDVDSRYRERIMKPHIPLIKFRYGKNIGDLGKQASGVAQSPDARPSPAKSSSLSSSGSSLATTEVPERFRRKSMTDEEMLAINTGGVRKF